MLGHTKKSKKITALFRAIDEGKWETASVIINEYPREVQQPVSVVVSECKKFSGYLLPIHKACCHEDVPLDLVRKLIKAYPKSLHITDSYYNRLALHWACLKIKDKRNDIIELLLQENPASASQTALYGRLPIHYASAGDVDPNVIRNLLRYYPFGARCQDKHEWLPIHLACLQGACSESVSVLLDSFPESVHLKTKKGNTPRQCAAVLKDGTTKEEIMSLLKKYEGNHDKFTSSISASVMNTNVCKRPTAVFQPLLTTAVASAEFC